MTGDSVEQQLAADKQQLLEMEQLEQKISQVEAEVQKLKESESNLKQKLEDKASDSKLEIQPGTPFSSIIRNIDFSTLKFQKLHKNFEKIPGIPTSIEEANPESYTDSPFVDKIDKIDLRRKFVVPSMRTYDGTADPQNHVAYYKQRMLAASIPSELRQVCMCKGFGTTPTGPALQLYINLPNGSVQSFTDLINSFNHEFASSRELEKRLSDLYRIKQNHNETIRAFLTRFNKEKFSIPRCDVGIAVEAFRQELPMDVQAKGLGYIRPEEDKSFKAETTNSVSGYERSSRKSSNYRGSNSMPSLYTRPDRSKVNYAYEQRGKSYTYPPIQEYNFSVDTAGLIKRLDNMGDFVKWPKKMDNPNSRKDTTRWCEFHMDIGHTIEECLGLRRRVA
ncbi:uncharacterized protein LOC141617102 [Silene latifolia]|uniref:uncharacterized protein LOC141617102 n=1 Tax=Silene latifolia TaxID=37657 RepID=UPI003D7775EA